MSLEVVTGDLFSFEGQVISHGVNCKGLMGAGIARAFRQRYPEMYKEYRMMCEEKLLRPGGFYPYRVRDDLTVINIASQEWPGPDAQLGWLKSGLQGAFAYMRVRGLSTFAMPKIGCGIGGLDWNEVEPVVRLLNQPDPDIKITVYSL